MIRRAQKSARRLWQAALLEALESRTLFSAPGTLAPAVVGHQLYYGQTPYYGDVQAAGKSVLVPGQSATFDNIITYVHGITMLALDVADAAASYSAADFSFRVGQSGDPVDWAQAPVPVSVTTLAGAGIAGSTRIVLRWSADSLLNEWLQVRFGAAGDTFYVGSLVGAVDAMSITPGCEATVRQNSSSLLSPISVDNCFDFNRDGKVDAIDSLVTRAANGNSLAPLTAPLDVVGRSIYYGNTLFYGDLLAADKSVLLPSQTATFANISTYAGGINEIVLDVAGGDAFSLNDFVFRAGTTGDPSTWDAAPAPSGLTVLPGQGLGGSTRLVIRWSGAALVNGWLSVNFAPAGDTFYVGSLVGSTGGLNVTPGDEAAVAGNYSFIPGTISLINKYDFNRDGKVDVTDRLIARAANGNALVALAAPALGEISPAAPTALEVSIQAPTVMHLIWTDNSDNETAFRIERRLASGNVWLPVATVGPDVTTYDDSTMAPATQYVYQVSAVNDAGGSLASGLAAITTPQLVSRDANGWTQVIPAADAQIIYVSSSTGDDANSGLSPTSPLRTIAQAEALFTTGHPVWLLLKAGDTWNEVIGGWKWGGTDAQRPSMISSYGIGARPVLQTGSQDGIELWGGGGAPATLDYIDIIGIDFYANARDPNSPDFTQADAAELGTGIAAARGGTGLLIEDCRMRFFGLGINVFGFDGPWTNVTIRRNVVVDSYSATDDENSQGILVSETHTLLIEENVLDHNGWYVSPLLPGAYATIFNHNMYLQYTNSDVTVRNNISADASSHGIQARSGGVITGNLLFNDPISLLVGSEQYSDPTLVADNVILYGTDIMSDTLQTRAWGLDIGSTAVTLVRGNIIANSMGADGGHALEVQGGTESTAVDNVIYQWVGGIIVDASANAVVGDGQVDPANLFDPGRSLGSYMASLGLTGTLDAFLAGARGLSKGNWNLAFTAQAANAYMRAGFVPAAPVNVTVVVSDPMPLLPAVLITWDAVGSATQGYIVESSTDNVNWVQVAAPVAGITSFLHADLISGTHYYYRVSAVNGIGTSVASSTADILLL